MNNIDRAIANISMAIGYLKDVSGNDRETNQLIEIRNKLFKQNMEITA